MSIYTAPFRPSFRAKLEDIFESYVGQIENTRHRQVLFKEARTTEVKPVAFTQIQNYLRPLYGKGTPLVPAIGDHPDFIHLRDTDLVMYSPITTMFVDIEGSTKLGLHLPLEEVFIIKNALICAAIEIINTFDGHVHRIMGDAVMAYFGSVDRSPESGIIDGINCVSVLKSFIDEVVKPAMNNRGIDDDIGIRIGLDFGKKDDVIWSCYGYQGMTEVTATSFYVDVAAKLQQSAGRNNIMIGQSLRDFIDFPEDLLDVKTRKKNGKVIPDPYITPNYAGPDGKPINYKKHLLKSDRYLRYSPIANEGLFAQNVPKIRAQVCDNEEGFPRSEYSSCSSILPKEKSLLFTYTLPVAVPYPYKVKVRVENHGVEAGKDLFHECVYEIRSTADEQNFRHWERTKYRGLHYLYLDIISSGFATMTGRFGVYIG